MSKIAVLDTHKRILEPCHPAVARRLLREGQAAVYKRYPFTIILKLEVTDPTTTDYTLSIDPGSKCTGLAITDAENNITAVFELHHRGSAIKRSLSARAGYRRSRRARKLRYRPPVGKTDPAKPLYAPKQVGYTNRLDKAVKGGSHPV